MKGRHSTVNAIVAITTWAKIAGFVAVVTFWALSGERALQRCRCWTNATFKHELCCMRCLQVAGFVEAVNHKIRRQMEELERLPGATVAPHTVEGVPLETYITR